MSIAFIPIIAKSNLYNEEAVTKKWTTFLNSLSKSLESSTNININQNEFNSIIEKTLLKHYSIPSISTPIKKEEKKEEKKEDKTKNDKDNEESEDDKDKEKEEISNKTKSTPKSSTKVKKIESKESKKKTEEKPRCKQILKNNEQCKGKSTRGTEFCTRHIPKKEESDEE